MRWTLDGTEAVLVLPCIRDNGDWDAFCRQHRHQ